jgi:hypothetical protein
MNKLINVNRQCHLFIVTINLWFHNNDVLVSMPLLEKRPLRFEGKFFAALAVTLGHNALKKNALNSL